MYRRSETEERILSRFNNEAARTYRTSILKQKVYCKLIVIHLSLLSVPICLLLKYIFCRLSCACVSAAPHQVWRRFQLNKVYPAFITMRQYIKRKTVWELMIFTDPTCSLLSCWAEGEIHIRYLQSRINVKQINPNTVQVFCKKADLRS